MFVGQSRRATGTARDHPVAGAPWDALRVGPDGPKLRSRSRSNTQSAHSIELNSFQDHPQLHGRHSSNVHESLPNELHGRHCFQDHEESTKFVKKTFHTIYRSKLVSSISNEMDPDGKTKILTILNIKLPHRTGIDNLWVKVDNGAEANILPLDSFRTMFPHALDEHSYPTAGFLERSKINLECYNDGWLINHGCIKLKLQHYLEKSFQDHNFYVVETKTRKWNHCWTLSKCQVRSHSCVMQECLQVHFSHRKQWKYQLQQLLSRPSTKYWWQTTTEAEK